MNRFRISVALNIMLIFTIIGMGISMLNAKVADPGDSTYLLDSPEARTAVLKSLAYSLDHKITFHPENINIIGDVELAFRYGSLTQYMLPGRKVMMTWSDRPSDLNLYPMLNCRTTKEDEENGYMNSSDNEKIYGFGPSFPTVDPKRAAEDFASMLTTRLSKLPQYNGRPVVIRDISKTVGETPGKIWGVTCRGVMYFDIVFRLPVKPLPWQRGPKMPEPEWIIKPKVF